MLAPARYERKQTSMPALKMKVLAAAVVVSGCAGGYSAASGGWLVAGPGLGEFGVSAGDTLFEHGPGAVSEPVRFETRRIAEGWEYPAQCARFFSGRGVLVSLLVARCDGSSFDDGEGLVVFDLEDGAVVGTRPSLTNEYTDIMPLTRPKT